MKKDDFEHDSLFGDLNADVPELDPSKQSQGAQAIQEKAADDDAAEAPETPEAAKEPNGSEPPETEELDADDAAPSPDDALEESPEEAATEEMAVGAATVGPAEEDGALTLARYASQAYLEYAMSVVKSRALPEVTDGQKPVQRRILIDMYRMGLKFEGRSVKSARIVGDVLGKYHPHGDQSVYDALVRMAQTFSLRYPLLVAEGNFGSRDGDSAAQLRRQFSGTGGAACQAAVCAAERFVGHCCWYGNRDPSAQSGRSRCGLRAAFGESRRRFKRNPGADAGSGLPMRRSDYYA